LKQVPQDKDEMLLGKSGERVSIPLDNLPEYAAALGRLLGHWAMLESLLMGTLGRALRVDHGLARLLWHEFISTRGKITLLQRLNHSMGDNELKSELGRILEEAQKLNTMRNAYIHAIWVVNAKGEVERHSHTAPGDYKKVFKDNQVITVADIEKDVLRISKLSGDLLYWQRCIQGGPPGMRIQPVE
jgi:hypothetical protein